MPQKFSQHTRTAMLFTKWSCCLLLGILIGSCKKDYTPDPTDEDKLVILAELTAGEMMRIPIAQTIPAGNGGLVKFEKVKDGTVMVKESNGSTWMLKPDLSGQFDDNPSTMYVAHRKFKHNMGYTIEIEHPVLGKAVAHTSIPGPVSVITFDTTTTLRNGKEMLTVDIVFQDPPENNHYVFEAVKQTITLKRYFIYQQTKHDLDTPEGAALYERIKNNPDIVLLRDTLDRHKFTRLELYTTDRNTDNASYASPDDPLHRILLPDRIFNGTPYIMKCYIDKKYFVAKEPGQRGKVLFQVKSASPELYRFLLTYEKYKAELGSIPADLLSTPIGNVQNGAGVFGGAAQKEFICWYDKF